MKVHSCMNTAVKLRKQYRNQVIANLLCFFLPPILVLSINYPVVNDHCFRVSTEAFEYKQMLEGIYIRAYISPINIKT